MHRFGFLFAWLLGLSCLLTAGPASAQQNASMNEMLEKIELQGARADRSPVPATELNAVNMQVHWRLWKRVYGEGDGGSDELTAMAQTGRSVGWVNLPTHAMAVSTLALGDEDKKRARAMFAGAQQMAPDLPYPYLLEAVWHWQNEPGDVGYWGRSIIDGVTAGVKWPDTNVLWLLKLLTYLLLGLVAGSAVFVVGQLLRNFTVAAYDLARMLPRGFSSNQTSVVLVAVIAVPGIVLKSPIVSVLVLLAVTALVQRNNERVVSLFVFGLVAALMPINTFLAELASYPGSRAQKLLHAQYVTCDAACLEELDALVEANPEDATIRFTALLGHFRTGTPEALDRVVEEAESTEWGSSVAGYAHNLAGAALVARAKPKEALEVLERTRSELPSSAAPRFNLMRAHQMLDDGDAAGRALQEASSRDIDQVNELLSYDRRDVNSFFAAAALPLASFFEYHLETAEPSRGPVEPVWSVLAGEKLTLEDHAHLLGGAGILLVFLGFFLARRTSTPCPRCGQARDPSETNKTGNHVYCYPCYSTFVTGATMDYDSRIHNEKVLGRRLAQQRLGRRLTTVLAPGLGHVFAGHAVTGFAIATSLAFAVLMLLEPLGPLRPSQEIGSLNWAAQVWIAWLILSVLILVVLNAVVRDIPPTIVKERAQR